MLNIRHIVQVGDHALLILVNGENVEVNPSYEKACASIKRLVEDNMG